MRVAHGRLGAGGTFVGATGGAVLWGGVMVTNRLPCGAASPLAVRPRVGVERPSVLLRRLHNPLRHWQVWRADIGAGQGPLVPGRLGAAVPCHITGLRPVVTVLVPVSMFSVPVRRRGRARPWSISVGSTGLLSPGLLLGAGLSSIIPLRRARCVLARVTSTLVVWSGTVSF